MIYSSTLDLFLVAHHKIRPQRPRGYSRKILLDLTNIEQCPDYYDIDEYAVDDSAFIGCGARMCPHKRAHEWSVAPKLVKIEIYIYIYIFIYVIMYSKESDP